jgi:hypothetical protein
MDGSPTSYVTIYLGTLDYAENKEKTSPARDVKISVTSKVHQISMGIATSPTICAYGDYNLVS